MERLTKEEKGYNSHLREWENERSKEMQACLAVLQSHLMFMPVKADP